MNGFLLCEIVQNGAPHTICQINAVLLAYLWTAIPGFGLAFVIEVMRMLLVFINFSKIDEPETLKKPSYAGSFRRKGSVDSNSSDTSHGSLASDGPTVVSLGSISEEGSSVRSNPSISWKIKKMWSRHWKRSIIFLPLVTALPSLIMVYELQAVMGWRYVHVDKFVCSPKTNPNKNTTVQSRLLADHFICAAPDPLVRRKKALIILCHLIPTSGLGIACVMTYFYLRYRTATGFHRRIHYPLLIRLSAMSALSGIGAALEFSIDFSLFNRGIGAHVPSLYLISFPLVSAAFFVDKEIIKEWKSWLRLSNR